MRLTKLGHACVRLHVDSTTLLIDPGSFSGADLYAGADAVLITHEHFDHLDRDALTGAMSANPDLTVWTNAQLAEQLADLAPRVHAVAHGDAVEIGGVDVHVYGRVHEPNHPDQTPPANVGFRIAGEVFHPGDAFTVPEDPTPTHLIPTNAPWMKLSDMIHYVREIAPPRAYSIHDGLLNDVGLQLVDTWLGGLAEGSGADIRRLPPGTALDLP